MSFRQTESKNHENLSAKIEENSPIHLLSTVTFKRRTAADAPRRPENEAPNFGTKSSATFLFLGIESLTSL